MGGAAPQWDSRLSAGLRACPKWKAALVSIGGLAPHVAGKADEAGARVHRALEGLRAWFGKGAWHREQGSSSARLSPRPKGRRATCVKSDYRESFELPPKFLEVGYSHMPAQRGGRAGK